MSREQVIANVGWARAFNALAPPAEDTSMQIDVDTLVSVLEALPGHAEVTLEFIWDSDERRTFDLMARDIPGPGRRFTNLTHGTEWFDIGGIIRNTDCQFTAVTQARRGAPDAPRDHALTTPGGECTQVHSPRYADTSPLTPERTDHDHLPDRQPLRRWQQPRRAPDADEHRRRVQRPLDRPKGSRRASCPTARASPTTAPSAATCSSSA